MALQNALQRILNDNDNPDVEDYLGNPRHGPADDEVQVIVNTVPFSHLAVRVGDRVYSYGVSHVTRTPPEIYFKPESAQSLNARILEAFDRIDELPPERQELLRKLVSEEDVQRLRTGNAPPDFLGKSARTVLDTVGLSRLPRTYQVVTLKVGKEERDRLMRHFELQKGKRYDNQTFVNDCATMIFRAMGMENPVIDPSPSLIVTTLQTRRNLGDDKVGRTFTVYGEGADRSKSLLIRDAYINYREASLHCALLPFNLPRRIHMDATYKPEDYQKWDPEIRREIESWRENVRRMEADENAVKLYRRLADQISGLDPADPATRRKKERLKTLVDDYLAEKRKEAERDYGAPESPLKDIFFATYRLEAYGELERDIYARLGFPVPGRP